MVLKVLSKPLQEITINDIRALIELEVPEGERIKFKKELLGVGGMPDPWMEGGKIAVQAKNRILKEVVAFANAYGGVLLIGIDEDRSGEESAVASAVTPIPRCKALAKSLELVFRDRVEPQLARVEIAGVQIADDDAGVVVIRVGKSRLAPHRITKTLICPVRRADRSEEMTMREIQDMTLNISRGLQGLREKLAERSGRFQGEFGHVERHDDKFGIRLTAIPVIDEVGIDVVFRQGSIVSELNTPWSEVTRQKPDGNQELNTPPEFLPFYWQPVLRGARAVNQAPGHEYLPLCQAYREIHCDGMVEFGLVSIADDVHNVFDPDWAIVLFANLALWADHVRKAENVPTLEYAIQVETRNFGNAGFIGRPGSLLRRRRQLSRLPNSVFPMYPLNDPQEILSLVGRFHRDLWNSMGEDGGDANFC